MKIFAVISAELLFLIPLGFAPAVEVRSKKSHQKKGLFAQIVHSLCYLPEGYFVLIVLQSRKSFKKSYPCLILMGE
ncbi:hypothetical protein [Oceanispirochaeta sp.]|uniref:hypothetical protein n=1 Tax=Oceanispirochaeta sp. TaxID=2035350 RepID=UPI00260C4C5F|nr:hypothetical protein [Oceanispirochaeta sp.]MDA3957980.1 hypothetical protein [Oceanispirochaeta sp.]